MPSHLGARCLLLKWYAIAVLVCANWLCSCMGLARRLLHTQRRHTRTLTQKHSAVYGMADFPSHIIFIFFFIAILTLPICLIFNDVAVVIDAPSMQWSKNKLVELRTLMGICAWGTDTDTDTDTKCWGRYSDPEYICCKWYDGSQRANRIYQLLAK